MELAELLGSVTSIGEGERVERQVWGEMQRFQGEVYVGKEAEVLEVASKWKDWPALSGRMGLG